MLIDFEVENFRSYRDTKRFSLVASAITELPGNLIQSPDPDLKLLKTAAIYGPNGSGKSNLLAAMHCLSDLIKTSDYRLPRAKLSPFILDKDSRGKSIRFKVRFFIEDVIFVYHITIQNYIIDEESLVVYPKGRPQEWFSRKGTDIEFSTSLKGQKRSLIGVTRREVSLLSVATFLDHPQLSKPARWLMSNLGDRFEFPGQSWQNHAIFGTWSEEKTTYLCQKNPDFYIWTNSFLRHADIGICGLIIRPVEFDVPKVIDRDDTSPMSPVSTVGPDTKLLPLFLHQSRDKKEILFLPGEESQGTRRLFAMLAPVYEALKDGQVAVIDELSASLHPSLVRELIRIFHDPKTNPKNAQLVFATHDASLLSGRFFRRDQVWFTEKTPDGSTDLYSLHDIKDVRKDEAFEDGYLRGRYGAIPFFRPFDFPPIREEEPTSPENAGGATGRPATSRPRAR